MSTKLTLSLNQEIIQQAKIYAKERGISLSALVENYLQKIVGEYQPPASKKTSVVDELSGIAPLPTDFDYREALRLHTLEKHQ